MGVLMNAKFFVALFGASVLMAAPVQAKFIGIAIYDPKVMLPICKDEITQGRAGVCTGYVIAISQGMQAYSAWVPNDSLCMPSGTEYEDMLQVVVSWAELTLRRNPEGAAAHDFRVLTEQALRTTWGCKK
jgi:hypothetical protein